jgi:hypothetical protein
LSLIRIVNGIYWIAQNVEIDENSE